MEIRSQIASILLDLETAKQQLLKIDTTPRALTTLDLRETYTHAVLAHMSIKCAHILAISMAAEIGDKFGAGPGT